MSSPSPRPARRDGDVAIRLAGFSKPHRESEGYSAAPAELLVLEHSPPKPKREINMASKALLVRLEAKPGKEGAVEEFLLSALPLVEQEPGTKPWLAVRFSPSVFGIIDAFPDEAAREAHLGGQVGKALAEKADELFASPPAISELDVLADKV